MSCDPVEDGAARGSAYNQALPRPGHGNIEEAAFFLHIGVQVGDGAGEDLLFQAGQKNHREFQPLGGMHGHEGHGLGPCVVDGGLGVLPEVFAKGLEIVAKGIGQLEQTLGLVPLGIDAQSGHGLGQGEGQSMLCGLAEIFEGFAHLPDTCRRAGRKGKGERCAVKIRAAQGEFFFQKGDGCLSDPGKVGNQLKMLV